MTDAERPGTAPPAAGSPDASLVGQLVAGRYQLVRLLGDGGMGAVYKAADVVLRRFVAIKLLHRSTTTRSPAAVDRFEREARAAAAIGHPNIIDILDFGVEAGRPYMVMEYLRGRSLSHVIATEGPLAVARAASIAAHTLAGLAAAHERGILHRDLKPANLMVVSRFGDKNFVKVCDFGFAALMGPTSAEDGKTLTPERTLVGTPAYAAPERLRGDDRRDPRTDVYSVGVVLFEMVAGRRPFDAPTFRELAKKVWNDPPPPLSTYRKQLPTGLEEVLHRALAKRPEDRFANASELAAALVPFGGRNVTLEDDTPSDSFAFEVREIRARDARKRGARADVAEGDNVGQAAPSRRVPPPARSLRSTLAPPGPRGRTTAAPDAAPADIPPVPRLPDLLPAQPSGMSPASAADHTTYPGRATFDADEPTFPQAGASVRAVGRVPSAAQPLNPAVVEGLRPHAEGALPPAAALVEPARVPLAVSGRLVLAILRFVARRYGERTVKVLLDGMPFDAREPFDEGVSDDTWVDGHAVRTLVEHIDAQLGDDDLNAVVECGRAAAEGAFDLLRALRPPSPPPELIVHELPAVFRAFFRGLDVVVRRAGPGFGRVELAEADVPSLTLDVLCLGFVERSLGRFGADEVEVNLLGARALDDPQTVIDVSWLT